MNSSTVSRSVNPENNLDRIHILNSIPFFFLLPLMSISNIYIHWKFIFLSTTFNCVWIYIQQVTIIMAWIESIPYLLDPVNSIVCPFFLHDTIGSGLPRGGPHSSMTVSPKATVVSCGSNRNSSLKLATLKVAFLLLAMP